MLKRLLPPPKWMLPVAIASGILVGIALFTFYISKAHAYLSDKPEACVNCHIMAPQYATWSRSSHREWAHCNDCHVPQDNFFRHYWFKANDGLRHATMFALRREPQVIFIHEAGKNVVQENCIRCHSDLLFNDKMDRYSMNGHEYRREKRCVDCHREVPHGTVYGLSAVPEAKGVPLPQSPVPAWLNSMMNKK